MNWLSILGIFAKPLGAIINKGIAAGAAAIIGYSVAKGNPLGDMAPVVSAIALGISTLISGFAATQGVQIPIINEDPNNGVKVVSSNNPGQAVNGPLK
jgi:hypothetical protein